MAQLWQILLDWRQLLEIGVLSVVIYAILYYSRKTHGARMMLVFFGMLLAFWILAQLIELPVITMLFEELYGSTIIALLIIFQPEVRRGLTQIGLIMGRRNRQEVIGDIEEAVINMASRKHGALIVIEGKERLQSLIDDAIQLDAQVKSQLLESIFFPNSPLHDGAVIIRGDRIVAARAILPLTRSKEVSPHMGTRHRAALGIAEESDAVTIMISEESGAVCIGFDGELHRDLSQFGLNRMLETLVGGKHSREFDETVELVSAEDEQNAISGAEDGGMRK